MVDGLWIEDFDYYADWIDDHEAQLRAVQADGG